MWLNADILEGPVNATQPPLNAARFLRLSRDVLAGSVLSPGWTTRFGPQLPNPLVNIRSGSYSMAHVQAMKQQLTDAGVDQAVTFPVRAGLLASTESKESLIWLLQQVEERAKESTRLEKNSKLTYDLKMFQKMSKKNIHLLVFFGRKSEAVQT